MFTTNADGVAELNVFTQAVVEPSVVRISFVKASASALNETEFCEAMLLSRKVINPTETIPIMVIATISSIKDRPREFNLPLGIFTLKTPLTYSFVKNFLSLGLNTRHPPHANYIMVTRHSALVNKLYILCANGDVNVSE